MCLGLSCARCCCWRSAVSDFPLEMNSHIKIYGFKKLIAQQYQSHDSLMLIFPFISHQNHPRKVNVFASSFLIFGFF